MLFLAARARAALCASFCAQVRAIFEQKRPRACARMATFATTNQRMLLLVGLFYILRDLEPRATLVASAANSRFVFYSTFKCTNTESESVAVVKDRART